MTPAALRNLLADSIAVWEVAGAKVVGAEDGVDVVAADGTVLRIRPAAAADARRL